MNKLIRTQLHLNGWIAALIGSFIVLDPVSMLSSYGLQNEISAGLMSELRAPGGLLLVCGLVIVSCSLRPAAIQNGLLLSAMVYGGYGSVRMLAMLIDGFPAMGIMLATAIELVLFMLSVVSLCHGRIRNQLVFGN